MVRTQYLTKDYTPAPGAYISDPRMRLATPRKKKINIPISISNKDLDFLTEFLKLSAFYVEDLEEYIGEKLFDFWESREHSLRIITDIMLQKTEANMKKMDVMA